MSVAGTLLTRSASPRRLPPPGRRGDAFCRPSPLGCRPDLDGVSPRWRLFAAGA